MAENLTLIGFTCDNCGLKFYLPQSDAGDGIKHGLTCPRCRSTDTIRYTDWLELGAIIKAAGNDTVRRCAEAIAS